MKKGESARAAVEAALTGQGQDQSIHIRVQMVKRFANRLRFHLSQMESASELKVLLIRVLLASESEECWCAGAYEIFCSVESWSPADTLTPSDQKKSSQALFVVITSNRFNS